MSLALKFYRKDELLVDGLFRDVCVELLRFDEPQEQFVDDLKMRPGQFQDRFVFFRIVHFAGWVQSRGKGPEEVDGNLVRI